MYFPPGLGLLAGDRYHPLIGVANWVWLLSFQTFALEYQYFAI